jgi:hypothetical protein
VGLNAYFHRPLGTNVLQNLSYAAGAAAVTATAGFALASGVVQQGLYAVGNTATRLCVTHPTACARVGAAFTLWDKVEDLGLQAKLVLQTWQRDPRAADTALELQLERLDNTPGNTTFRELQESLSTLVGRYGDDVARLVKRFGNEGAELLASHQDEAVEFLHRHQDEAQTVTRYVKNVVDVELAQINLERGYVVSKLAQEVNVPITITGRWADTPAEAALRRQAAEEWKILVSQGIDPDFAKVQIGQKYGIDPQQVKASSNRLDEIDVFIPKNAWDRLSFEQKSTITHKLVEAFNIKDLPDFTVDFYQELPLDKIRLGWPDPRINLPPGSIIFNADGTIVHQPFAAP